jgi:hypothetical protein
MRKEVELRSTDSRGRLSPHKLFGQLRKLFGQLRKLFGKVRELSANCATCFFHGSG